jgi:hypothetical protein
LNIRSTEAGLHNSPRRAFATHPGGASKNLSNPVFTVAKRFPFQLAIYGKRWFQNLIFRWLKSLTSLGIIFTYSGYFVFGSPQGVCSVFISYRKRTLAKHQIIKSDDHQMLPTNYN